MKKKRKIRNLKKNSKHKPIFHNPVLFLLIFSAILITGLGLFKFIPKEIKSVIETPKHDTKKIPPEIKNRLNSNFSPSYTIPVLLYHYVEYVQDEKDTIRKSLNINPNIFEAQVKTLRDNRYTFMTAKELGEVIDGKRDMPQKPVLLTFDDGHWDFDKVILPILKKYHAKATAYVIPGFIDGSDFMSDEEMKNVVKSNLVDIGAHTVHHVYLKGKLLPIVQYEVNQSKKILEKRYNINVVSFAYPDGAFDQQTIDVVKRAGFTTAVTTIPGIVQTKQNRFFLFRLRPGYRTGKELINYFKQTEFKPY